jgi:serine/threonine-protein kinase HipA
MAGRPSLKKSLDVWMNGEFVGVWSFAPSGGHTFTYDSSWLEKPEGR